MLWWRNFYLFMMFITWICWSIDTKKQGTEHYILAGFIPGLFWYMIVPFYLFIKILKFLGVKDADT